MGATQHLLQCYTFSVLSYLAEPFDGDSVKRTFLHPFVSRLRAASRQASLIAIICLFNVMIQARGIWDYTA